MNKSSIKILIITTGVLIALLVTGLMILRTDIIEIVAELEKNSKFREVEAEKFRGVDFSENWSVRITPGIQQKVEVEFDEQVYKTRLENRNGILHFTMDVKDSTAMPKTVKARITTPFIYEIRASKGTNIDLERFDLDSLYVEIEDQGSFKGSENKFEYVSFKTLGKVGIEWIDDPF